MGDRRPFTSRVSTAGEAGGYTYGGDKRSSAMFAGSFEDHRDAFGRTSSTVKESREPAQRDAFGHPYSGTIPDSVHPSVSRDSTRKSRSKSPAPRRHHRRHKSPPQSSQSQSASQEVPRTDISKFFSAGRRETAIDTERWREPPKFDKYGQTVHTEAAKGRVRHGDLEGGFGLVSRYTEGSNGNDWRHTEMGAVWNAPEKISGKEYVSEEVDNRDGTQTTTRTRNSTFTGPSPKAANEFEPFLRRLK